jgi:alpha-galactosidase
MHIDWKDLGIHSPVSARDLWSKRELGVFANKFETVVPAHGVVMLRIVPKGN